jgi:CubicO group peptidase (beta-lactamase class C family)
MTFGHVDSDKGKTPRLNLPRCILFVAAMVLLPACGGRTHASSENPAPATIESGTPVGAGTVAAVPSTALPPAVASAATPQPDDPAARAVRESPAVQAALGSLGRQLDAERQRRGVSGMSVSVVYDQSLLWSKGFGVADVETGEPATSTTLYRVGSITKLFTDTMMMQLRDEGKLNLDDPLQTYIPELQITNPYGGSQPTLRELASHTSGLPREAPLNYWREREFPTEDQLIASLRNASLVGPPGTTYQYSNLGVALEGIALERVAGEQYISYETRHILAPLGMTDSGFTLTDAVRSRLAVGSTAVSASSGGQDRLPDFVALAPAAELYTSVDDIAKFMSLQFRDGDSSDVLSGASLREMRSLDSRGGPSDFAIGWELGSIAGHSTIGHPGVVYGFTTQITLIPDAKLGVAVFTNGRTDPAGIASLALTTLLGSVRDAAAH